MNFHKYSFCIICFRGGKINILKIIVTVHIQLQVIIILDDINCLKIWFQNTMFFFSKNYFYNIF